MHYIEIKQFELKKGSGRAFADGLAKNSVIKSVDGFLNLKIGLCETCHHYDTVEVTYTWRDEDAYTEFKRSDLHQSLHRQRKPNPDVIKHSSYRYTLIHDINQ